MYNTYAAFFPCLCYCICPFSWTAVQSTIGFACHARKWVALHLVARRQAVRGIWEMISLKIDLYLLLEREERNEDRITTKVVRAPGVGCRRHGCARPPEHRPLGHLQGRAGPGQREAVRRGQVPPAGPQAGHRVQRAGAALQPLRGGPAHDLRQGEPWSDANISKSST
eukprot:scaffold73110_cov35-Prasinocladus_malaysianus.AAC.1